MNNKQLYIGISEKNNGSMKGSLENSNLYFKGLGLDKKIIVSAGLVHGSRVAIVDDIEKSQVIHACDALITNDSKYLLTTTVADCLPIYFYDEPKGVIALAHAGWRGLVANICAEVINVFTGHYKSNPVDIKVYVGPHIRACHFEVKTDLISVFQDTDILYKEDKMYVDLAKVLKRQLAKLNIAYQNIYISPECTYCQEDKYFSYRRDKPEKLETMLCYLGLRQ